jgi:hypothetical protein
MHSLKLITKLIYSTVGTSIGISGDSVLVQVHKPSIQIDCSWFIILATLNSLTSFSCFLYWSFAKHLESANTMFSFIWWVIGFYWISAGGQTLSTQAPQLYWYAPTIKFIIYAKLHIWSSYIWMKIIWWWSCNLSW